MFAGLMFAVGEAGVPELAHDGQRLVDHVVVDLGHTELLGAVEELGDEQVLALGSELDDAVRRGRRDAGVAEHPGRVVLVLDEAAHALERPFVLQAAVQDRAAELVPAVGPHMAHRIELPEEVSIRGAGDLQPQRRRTTGTLEADRLDVDDGQAHLLVHGAADRHPPRTADVEMGRLAAPVRHRERLVGREPSKGVDEDGHGERHAECRVEGVVDPEVDAGGSEDRDHAGGHDLGGHPGTPGDDERVGDADRQDRDDGDGG